MSRVGLIPTYAGNTVPCVGYVRRSRAHPHVCGEHKGGVSVGAYAWGSSPRMRGTLVVACKGFEAFGLIPTYAGNTHLSEHDFYP